MRLAIAALITLSLPLVAQAQTPRAKGAGLAEIARQCPRQHLGDLSALDLGRRMQAFEARLPESQRHAIQDTVGRRCALIEGGDTCANDAALSAYRRLKLMKAFAAAACAPETP